MTKRRVLEDLARMARGENAKNSHIARELLTCPQFQSSSRVLQKALQHNQYGRGRRGSSLLLPPGFIPPG
jgi:hypothetical protein